MDEFYVYRHIRLDTGLPFYIGKGSGNRANNMAKRSKHHQNIVKKHGVRVEIILKYLTEEEAFCKEKYFIKLYGRKDLGVGYLVNMTDGGEGISGFRYTVEERAKISSRQIGKKTSDKTKVKMSKAQMGKKLSDKHKIKISKAICRKIINCRNEIFDSLNTAAEAFNLSGHTSISECCSGKRKSAGKYPDGSRVVWSYHG